MTNENRTFQSRSSHTTEAEIGFEITLLDVLRTLWRGKWVILLTVFVTLGLAVFYVHLQKPEYTAQMIVAPIISSQTSADSLQEAAERFGISNIGDINQEITNFHKLRGIIISTDFSRYLQEKHNILQTIYLKRWDSEKNQWVARPHADILSKWTAMIKKFVHMPAESTPPDERSLADFLDRNVEFTRLSELGLWSMTLQHPDPQFAGRLLNLVYTEAEDYLRQQRVHQVREQINYLRERLAQVGVIEHREALIQLLGRRERKMMMLQGNLPFAAEVIDSVSVSANPTSPKTPLILVAAIALGFLVGTLFVMIVYSFRLDRQRRRRKNAYVSAIDEDERRESLASPSKRV